MIIAYFTSIQKQIATFLVYLLLIQAILPAAYAGTTRNNEIALSLEKIKKSAIKTTILHTPSKASLASPNKHRTMLIRPINFPKKDVGKMPALIMPQLSQVEHLDKADGGPGQPEHQGFQSVNIAKMVDLFSGDFSYNIPLLDVGGYPVNIYYRGGVSMDQEASWVGLGWNINPGSVTRNMRGIPDDFRGDKITKTQTVRPNWTAGVNAGFSPEIFGRELPLSLSAGLFYNNQRGVGFEVGAQISATISGGSGASVGSTSSLGLNLKNNSQNGFSIEPSFSLNLTRMESASQGSSFGFNVGTSFNTRRGMEDLSFSFSGSGKAKKDNQELRWNTPRLGSGISFVNASYTPSMSIPFTSYQYSFRVKGGGEWFGFHPLASIGGYYSKQYIDNGDRTLTSPAFGYLNLQNGIKDVKNLLDFNREKELAYSPNPPTPHLAVPNYTYDIFSIGGEGTGGMFRAYRGDIGYVRDAVMQSKSNSANGGVDLGVGNAWHGGVDVQLSFTTTKTGGGWGYGNVLNTQNAFAHKDSSFENVYFKNPSEKTSVDQSFSDAIGGTKVVSPSLTTTNNSLVGNDGTLASVLQSYENARASGAPLNFSKPIRKNTRDKRSQVISYLNASEAANFGLDLSLVSYPYNEFSANSCSVPANAKIETRVNAFRQPHHISEFTVLNEDGRRYVYGMPTYNLSQNDVSFSVDVKRDAIKGDLVSYSPNENSTGNRSGKDRYYMKSKMPAYANGFLITGVLSPDYMDRTGDGITDDDQGDAVKFTYTKLYGEENPYQWRTPYFANTANYQEGLRTDISDDKGSYIHGSKEIWYLNGIVTKTMIATFTLNDPSKGEIRQDGYGVMGENGGIDTKQALRYLKQIDLYSKADYLANGKMATPVKTIHFAYSYTLCPNAPGSLNNQGKLTLDSIWFSYNNTTSGKENPYTFRYHKNNPNYDNGAYDRWGGYKPATLNPSNLSNANYPYAVQDSSIAAYNAGAWNLETIKLPSGGAIKVDYEADDYAYVQNKTAGQMMQVVGFAHSAGSTAPSNLLYDKNGDQSYIFIKVPEAVMNKNEVYVKYLQGVSKIYFSYRVKMPTDLYGGGYEHISVYAQYSDYGVSSFDKQVIWVRMKSATGDIGFVSPMAMAAIQALRLNLPSKAYPGSDLDGDFSPIALGKALIGFIGNFGSLIRTFPAYCRNRGIAQEVSCPISFARLNNPLYKKYGGGYRVKRVTISDNFDKMTGAPASVYGQEYDYSTTKKVNGKDIGVSSGVAAWEPTIGNDENPFRLPIEYNTQVAPLAPANRMYSEYPLGECFFPAPQVGYSKVRTHTIHNTVASANGYEESEFYTNYDFPTITENSPLQQTQFKTPFLANLFKINARNLLTQVQGFKIEINDMNGKPKATSTYPETDPKNPLTYTKYYYRVDDQNAPIKHLNNQISIIDANLNINPKGEVGKDMELMIDLREENTETFGADLQFNVDGFIVGLGPLGAPIVIPTLWIFPQFEQKRYRSAVVTKLVQRFGILEKVVQYEKGSLVTTENLLFDGETGNVVLTKTQNEFDDPVYNYNYPAHWAYSGMEPAYKNIGAVFNNVGFSNGKLVAPQYNNIDQFFESGDEIMVYNSYPKTGMNNNTNECTGEGYCPSNVYSTKPKLIRLWAINPSKLQQSSGLNGIYFIDQKGNFYSDNSFLKDSIIILRSGKRNLLTTAVGQVQSLASPARQLNGQTKIVFDDATKVVQTNASSYKDLWKTEDVQLQISTTLTQKTLADTTVVFTPLTAFTATELWDTDEGFLNWGPSIKNRYYGSYGQNYFEGSEAAWRPKRKHTRGDFQKSWLKFDLKSIPWNAQVVDAKLYLRQHLQVHNYPLPDANVQNSQNNENHTDAGQPHNNTRDNTVYLGRVTNPFFTIFSRNPGSLDANTAKTLFTQSRISQQSKAFIPQTSKQNSSLVNVTKIVAEMVNNYNDPYTIEIGTTAQNKSAIVKQTDEIRRQCYWAKDLIYAPRRPIQLSWWMSRYRIQPPQPTDFCQIAKEPLGYLSPTAFGSTPVTNTSWGACKVGPRLVVTYRKCSGNLQAVCDTMYCIQTKVQQGCSTVVKDVVFNPYLYGALGNWRQDKSYVYYDSRKEKDPTQKTSIRYDGAIANFIPYWNFSNTSLKLQPTTDTLKWVWNTESILFNKRGLELENRNALGIFNAAQYGYNQSLPVAVTQNARYKEQAYDGFEDYAFPNTAVSCKNCPVTRHFAITPSVSKIITNKSHTGKYSLAISSGNRETLRFRIDKPSDTAINLYAKIDTTKLTSGMFITPQGTYWKDSLFKPSQTPAQYFDSDNYGLDGFNYSKWGLTGPTSIGQSPVDYHNGYATWYEGWWLWRRLVVRQGAQFYKKVWEGALMTDVDRNVIFKVHADNSFKLWIDDKLVLNAFPNDPAVYGDNNQFLLSNPDKPIHIARGKIYKIRIEHTNGTGAGYANLYWKDQTEYNYTLIPQQYQYPSITAATAAIKKTSSTCINPVGVINKNVVYSNFAPIQNTNILISAWVSEDQDCKCSSYTSPIISGQFLVADNTYQSIGTLKPMGNIIDGWQRVEGYITIPSNAQELQLFLNNNAANGYKGQVYFDDIRIQPYNAEMKSFVYDDKSLRLMAELDANNYASFYEYDVEGSLIRIKKETEQGIKTIKETRNGLIRNSQ